MAYRNSRGEKSSQLGMPSYSQDEWVTQLKAMSQWCKTENVPFHMDGARLWESSSAYERTEAQISELFDSIYVSLCKGNVAMAGAILAGESDFIDSCKAWRNRLGGNAFTSFPMIIGALDGLENRLKLIPEFLVRAKSIAYLLTQYSQLEVDTPQKNVFLFVARAI